MPAPIVTGNYIMDIQPLTSAAIPAPVSEKFEWIDFYQSMADAILSFRDRRRELARVAYNAVDLGTGGTYLTDIFEDGSEGPLRDICPFTVMGTFNRWMTDSNRKKIAGILADFLKVKEKVPDTFRGIPYLTNQNAWFFGLSLNPRRKEGNIDRLWDTFDCAIAFADSDNENTRAAFIKAYNISMGQFKVNWNLAAGLYWIRPLQFPPLDEKSREYIENKLGIRIRRYGPKGCCNASDYLLLRDTLKAGFSKGENREIKSFPELTFKACE